MPSILPGFEYDIFISYRQKDNKGDRWVSHFVQALKAELDSTFKEDVSIYFDENPRDGLLETHLVDESLSRKLKCLVFIPILSQTYCDPKSFAWNHEFLTFNTLASADTFGPEVTLKNGNITRRVLPVRIHELDAQDEALIAKELKGQLRSIDFIYHSVGVNRPLRPEDETIRDNEYKTIYRNQVNKVANAVKEIILALKNHDQPFTQIDQSAGKKQHQPFSPSTKRKLKTAIFILAVALAGYLLYYAGSAKSVPVIDKSIAVLPFENMGHNPDEEDLSDGLTDEIIHQLAKVKELQVTSRTSSMMYKASASSSKSLKQIATELGVTKILEGTVRTSGNQMRIGVELIDAETDKHLWSETYEQPKDINSIFVVQKEIALNIARELKAILTPHEEKSLQQIPTRNLEAYQLFLRARLIAQDREMESILQSIGLIHQALELDPEFITAKCELANLYFLYKDWNYPNSEGFYEKAEALAKEVIQKDPEQSMAYSVLSGVCVGLANFRDFRKNLLLAVANDPADVEILHRSAGFFAMLGYKQAATALIQKALKSDPFSPIVNNNYMRVLLYNREYGLAIKKLPEVLRHIPENSTLKQSLVEQFHFELGHCDSLQSSFNKTLCLAIHGKSKLAQKEFRTLAFGDTEQGLLLKSYFSAIVNRDADALFKTLEVMSRDARLKSSLCYLKTDPVYDPFRNDPRFEQLMIDIGLVDPQPVSSGF